MATYSQGITGAPAENSFQPASLAIPDGASRIGDQQRSMSQNTPFLARGPDGSVGWYVFDASRSVPGSSRILTRLSP